MTKKSLFLIINSITIGSVIILILVGGIVRSVGAGMGCPDWPKCFGSYIPPTSSDQLPDNYLDTFKEQRLKKNERLASIFSKLGYGELSKKITTDPDIQKEEEFNVTKAWIEYINRLIGVLIGLFIFLNMVFAFRLKSGKLLPLLGVLVFVLTGFQGWVGSLVVSTNLLHGFITFHMLLALLILALLIWMGVRAREMDRKRNSKLFYLSIILLFLVIVQVILGTEVRGVVDDLSSSESDREKWFDSLSTIFFVHRSYSWLLLLGGFVLLKQMKIAKFQELLPSVYALVSLVVIAGFAGFALTNFGFPSWLQPVHLLLATCIFSLVFYLTLRLKKT